MSGYFTLGPGVGKLAPAAEAYPSTSHTSCLVVHGDLLDKLRMQERERL